MDNKQWSLISKDVMAFAFLRAEAHKLAKLGLATVEELERLLRKPDLSDYNESAARLNLLVKFRSDLLDAMPKFIDWYYVRNLNTADLNAIYAINHPRWRWPTDRNELLAVAARKPLKLQIDPEKWAPPILIGHQRSGPFSILEGNHRLTAYAASGRTDLDIPVIIGLSPQRCRWSIFDSGR